MTPAGVTGPPILAAYIISNVETGELFPENLGVGSLPSPRSSILRESGRSFYDWNPKNRPGGPGEGDKGIPSPRQIASPGPNRKRERGIGRSSGDAGIAIPSFPSPER